MTVRNINGHTLYLGNKVRGSVTTPFARCLCGAYLVGKAEIDEHRQSLTKGARDDTTPHLSVLS